MSCDFFYKSSVAFLIRLSIVFQSYQDEGMVIMTHSPETHFHPVPLIAAGGSENRFSYL